jgi:hypothetical protein
MWDMAKTSRTPILDNKHYGDTSAFVSENLLREARRQKGLKDVLVPEVCGLDPDGDIVRQMQRAGGVATIAAWGRRQSVHNGPPLPRANG